MKKIGIIFLAIISVLCLTVEGRGSEDAQEAKMRHPGHRMKVSYTPKKKSFVIGEPVEVVLKIQNIGEQDFCFIRGGRQRGFRDNQFAFSAQAGDRMLPDIGNPRHFGGKGSYTTLKPGESVEIPVDLKKWFDFDQAGSFDVRGSYYMSLCDASAESKPRIWEDFACAEFVILITEANKAEQDNR